VVLDVRLPKKSGLEVCELLRQDPDDPHVPIILVSAAAETEARLQGLARGADDYVAKPFSPKELIARIRRLLARSSETREGLRPLCAHADGRVGIAKLAIDGCGELARLLCGLGRPVRRHELERFPELRHELPQLVAAGLTLLAPLCGPEGLEGLILVDERLD